MPNFFEEVDALGVVEDHAKAMRALEESQAKEMMRGYSEVRKDLRDRLDRIPETTFTAQHLRGVLAQVESSMLEMNKSLLGRMEDGSLQAAQLGLEHLLDEIRVFDGEFSGAVTPINLNAALAARDTAGLLVTKYRTNLNAYGGDLLARISNGLFAASIGELNAAEVARRIGVTFQAEEWKLTRIVRTEMHHIYNTGKVDGMVKLSDEELPDLMKTLMHPMDARTGEDSEYAASLHLVAAIEDSFRYTWKGKIREFYAPPDRPNDRSIVVPYRRAWGAARGDAFLPGSLL
jgi:hypothetical protein